jgi:hypothetical protein
VHLFCSHRTSVRRGARAAAAFQVVERYPVPLTLERVLVVALIIGLLGLGGMVWCVVQWADVGFGHLQYGVIIKIFDRIDRKHRFSAAAPVYSISLGNY